MTRERMGEIALLIMKMALTEHDDWDREVSDEEVEEMSQEIGIPKEEVREFVDKICQEAAEEREK